MINRKNISIILNLICGTFALTGTSLALIYAKQEGFDNAGQRLLYFTQLSNIWIGVVCLVISILSVTEVIKKKRILKNYIYILKYIFTVSITITGLIFCGLLAPFAEFNVWTLSSILTHVIVPITAIICYFVEEPLAPLKKSHIILTTIPPLIYFIFGSILSVLKVNFGRGQTYPYFFMNYDTEVGLFGFRNVDRPEMGSFYWIIVILLLILGISYLYYCLHSTTRNNKNNETILK